MNVLSNLHFSNSGPIFDYLNEFPSSPINGQMILVNGAVYVYTTIQGVQTWFPLTNEKNYLVFTQAIESTEWTITHDLGTSDFIFFTYDENKNLMESTYDYINDNEFKLIFSTAKKGRLVLFFAADANAVNKQYDIHKESFICTADQTIFEMNSFFNYEYIDVFLLGTKLVPSDFTIVDNILTLAVGTTSGDILDITTYGQVNFTDFGYAKTEFVATAGQTVFNAPHFFTVDVYVNGVLLNSTEYSHITGEAGSVTLATPLTVGDIVIIKTSMTSKFDGVYNKTEIDEKFSNTLITQDVINNLISNNVTKPLSANQGLILKGLIDTINSEISNIDNTSDLLKPVSTAVQTELDLKADKLTTYTKTEVDTITGDISAAIDLINGEVI